MNIYLTISLTSFLAAITTAIAWLLLRRFASTTKSAWSMAIAIGYAVGHVSYLACSGVSGDAGLTTAINQWTAQIPTACKAIVWPSTVINWMPIGVLLAGLVSTNSALFPFGHAIRVTGAVLISFWLGIQLIGGVGLMQGNWFNTGHGLRLAIGTTAMVLCWISLQNSIQGKSRKVWIGCVYTLAVSVVAVLVIIGHSTLAVLGGILLAAMLGGIAASLMRSAGTDNIRFSGAVISIICIGLLLLSWCSGAAWYPLALLVVGFTVVNFWLPEFLGSQKKRASMAVGCSLLSLVVSVLLRYGVI